jgi:hypothetical protein
MNLRSVGWRLSALLGLAGGFGLTPRPVVTEARATRVDVRADTGVAGYWEARTVEGGKLLTFTFDFDVDGTTLSGDFGIPRRNVTEPILRGSVRGPYLEFSGVFGNWSGTLIGNELRLTQGLCCLFGYNGFGRHRYLWAHHAVRPDTSGKAADLIR